MADWWALPGVELGFVMGLSKPYGDWLMQLADARTEFPEIPLVRVSGAQQPALLRFSCTVPERGAPGELFDSMIEEFSDIAPLLGPLEPGSIVYERSNDGVVLSLCVTDQFLWYDRAVWRTLLSYTSQVTRYMPGLYLGTGLRSEFYVHAMPDYPEEEHLYPAWLGFAVLIGGAWYLLKRMQVGQARVSCFPTWRRFLRVSDRAHARI